MHTRYSIFFFFNDTATTEIYTLSLHDALPISPNLPPTSTQLPVFKYQLIVFWPATYVLFVTLVVTGQNTISRSEEHTSELQSQSNLVCRLLLEKKKKKKLRIINQTSIPLCDIR